MPEFTPNLETKLNEFLDTGGTLKETLSRLADWQLAHDAAHKKLTEDSERNTASYHYRISTLEAAAGKGWSGAIRTALIIMLAAGSGYAVRAAATSNPTASAPAR